MGDSSSNNMLENNAAEGLAMEHKYSIPEGYGDNKIVLMVRDPWTIYSYWEVSKDVEGSLRSEIKSKGFVVSGSVLRVYDVTDGEEDLPGKINFDFTLTDWIDKWYVHTGKPGRKWMVEIGLICTNGEFFMLARSNVVCAPNYGMSGDLDEKWMCSEDLYYKMFAVSGGHGIGTSSLSIKEMVERQLEEWVSSGGSFSSMFGGASLFSRKKKS